MARARPCCTTPSIRHYDRYDLSYDDECLTTGRHGGVSEAVCIEDAQSMNTRECRTRYLYCTAGAGYCTYSRTNTVISSPDGLRRTK